MAETKDVDGTKASPKELAKAVAGSAPAAPAAAAPAAAAPVAAAPSKLTSETIVVDAEIPDGVATGDGVVEAAAPVAPVQTEVSEVLVRVDPARCPKTHCNMFFAGPRRVALTSGRVYVFEAGVPQYVHRDDRDAVAAAGGADYTG